MRKTVFPFSYKGKIYSEFPCVLGYPIYCIVHIMPLHFHSCEGMLLGFLAL